VNLLSGSPIAVSDQVCDAVREWPQKNLDDCPMDVEQVLTAVEGGAGRRGWMDRSINRTKCTTRRGHSALRGINGSCADVSSGAQVGTA
jgi:hypothetical protein